MQYYFIIVGGKKLSRIVEKFILKLIEYQNIRLFILSLKVDEYTIHLHRGQEESEEMEQKRIAL